MTARDAIAQTNRNEGRLVSQGSPEETKSQNQVLAVSEGGGQVLGGGTGGTNIALNNNSSINSHSQNLSSVARPR